MTTLNKLSIFLFKLGCFDEHNVWVACGAGMIHATEICICRNSERKKNLLNANAIFANMYTVIESEEKFENIMICIDEAMIWTIGYTNVIFTSPKHITEKNLEKELMCILK